MAEQRERIYRLGMADPRTGPERLAGALNKAFASREKKRQNRKYDDSPTTMAKNRRAK